MSSLYKENDRGTVAWRLRFFLHKKRHSLRLGKCTKKDATEVQRHVDVLLRSQQLATLPAADTVNWLQRVDRRIQQALVALGLCEAQGEDAGMEAGQLLGPFLDKYIETRTDCSANTISNFKQARRELVEKFGEKCPLRSLTPADGDRWRADMLSKPLAIATVSKHVKRAKTMLNSAVADNYLHTNPFASLKGGSETNSSRHFFVTRAMADAVLAQCPDTDWQLIFALPRFAGLRCPTEVTRLEWQHIDWLNKRIRVESPKTGTRYCPLFPELVPYLHAAKAATYAHPVYCVSQHRGDKNFATTLQKIIVKAGLKPWPKTFVNLRSTRRTELQESFPGHVIDEWLGHSSKTADLHYLQVTDSHWELATQVLPPLAADQT
jgi:integrase